MLGRLGEWRKYSQPVLFGIAIFLLFTAAAVSSQPKQPGQESESEVGQQVLAATDEVLTTSPAEPDEVKPDNTFSWSGGPADPKYISLPSIGAEGYIQKVGVDQHQQIAVPSNIHIAGWFVNSVLPGQKGLSIIDGHLDGRTGGGIFLDLERVKKGDEFSVEFGNGTVKNFRVTKVIIVDAEDAPSVLFSQNPKTTSQLNLVTCAGSFDPASRLYDKRVIVYSRTI